MRQYMMSVHHVEGEPPPPPETMAQIYKDVDALNDELQAAGVEVFGGGLEQPDQATVVRNESGEVVMTDGPFAETQEHLGGFWVIKAPDLDAALAWAEKASLRARGPWRCGRSRRKPRSEHPAGRSCDRAGLPCRVRAGGRHPGTRLRRHRHRRGRGPGRLRHRDPQWPDSGMPPNPGGWITTTARRRAIDRLRRESRRNDRHAQAALLHERDDRGPEGFMHDDRLRLIFTCCHPALATHAQIALTLRLRAEAIRLGRLLAALLPDEPEVAGLLALMLLSAARRPARTAPDGSLVLLADQDRSQWDAELVAEGQALVRACLRRNRPGPYQLQAAINAVHSDGASAADTDWDQILALYDQLMAISPTAVVALNRAVALAEVEGPAAALAVAEAAASG